MDSLRTELETLNSSTAAILEYLKGDDVRSTKLLDELESTPDHIKKAKTSIFESTTAIQQLVTSPVEYHQQLLIHYQYIACIRWLCRFEVPTIVPEHGSMTYHEIARKASVPESQLRRICRMARTSGLFEEVDEDTLAHSTLSKQLRQGSSFLDAMMFLTEMSSRSASKMVERTERFGPTSAKNETAFNIAFDTDLPFYGYLSQNPALGARFAGTMRFLGAGQEFHLDHLINGYNWAVLGEARIVDVGGSQGHASIALASKFPRLRFIVQDLPDVVERAKKTLLSHPLEPSVASRLTFEAHNFFHPQPHSSRGADVFFARLIFSNYDDEEAVTILNNLVSAMGRNSRLIIMSAVLPEPGTVSLREEALERATDLGKLQLLNGKERDLRDWKMLFEQVPTKLMLKAMTKPVGSTLSILEIMLESTS
ncbi:hypothetical protein LTR41_008947 [Exophiala xenobiotica]|nr:hypothetical protein LTR41_008947 [Exophiala xenobiotica]